MPEIRKNPVTGECVIIATERSKRPNDFTRSYELKGNGNCVFCYGNENKTPPEVLAYRLQGGKPNESGWTVRAFPNKFPAVAPGNSPLPQGMSTESCMPAIGVHEVIVDSPDHGGSLGRFTEIQAEQVITVIAQRYKSISGVSGVKYIQVFKNSGVMAGASIEHTHWQVITLPVIPDVFRKEFAGVKSHHEKYGNCIYCKTAQDEIAGGERLVEDTDSFVVITPYASRFPFEVLVLPKQHEADFGSTPQGVLNSLARVLRRTVRRFERAFDYPPYNIVIHTSPVEKGYELFHWHIEILPRLSVAAGFEWGTGIFINPTSPEVAAAALRETDPDVLEN